jgi:hypothetical protein
LESAAVAASGVLSNTTATTCVPFAFTDWMSKGTPACLQVSVDGAPSRWQMFSEALQV